VVQEGCEEDPVRAVEAGSFVLVLEDGQLVAQGQDLKSLSVPPMVRNLIRANMPVRAR
jgi:hypothetical protein